MNLSLRIITLFFTLNTQTFLLSMDIGAGNSSPRKTEQSSPRKMEQPPLELKRGDVCEVICGPNGGKKVLILGSCVTCWQASSLKNLAEKKPLLFARPEVQKYCEALTGKTNKALKRYNQKFDEPFYVAEFVIASVFDDPRGCFHPSQLKKISVKDVEK